MELRVRNVGAAVALSLAIAVGGLSSSARAQPGCPCDWNQSGLVSVQDIFDFLASYFGGDGDFNCSGITSPQDIFDFLACFFGGCPSYAGDLAPNDPADHESAATCSPVCAAGDRFPPLIRGVERVRGFSGEVVDSVSDLRIKGRGFDFLFGRYRSQLRPEGSVLGHGWDFSYNIYLEQCGSRRILHNGWGRADTYAQQTATTWQSAGFFRELSENPDGSYTLMFADMGRWNFRSFAPPGGIAPGRLSSIVDRNGNTMTFSYDAASRLVQIVDTLGRQVVFIYNADGRIVSMIDYTGRSVEYGYYGPSDPGGSAGDLRSVRSPIVTTAHNPYPAGKSWVYTYTRGFADDLRNHNLLTATDPRGLTILSIQYDAASNPGDPGYNRALLARMGDAGDVSTLSYQPVAPALTNNFAILRTLVVDRLGHTKDAFYDARNHIVMLQELTLGLHPGEPAQYETRWAYNGDGLPTRLDRPRGNFETWSYDSANPSVRARGNLLLHTRDSAGLGGGGSPPVISESFEYSPGFGGCCGTNFVTRHVDWRGHQTLHSYDAAGNRAQTVYPIAGIVEDWRYNAFGQLTKHIHPALGIGGAGCRRVDTFSYHAAGAQTGYLEAMTVAATDPDACAGPHLDLVTRHEYDAVGNAVRQVDPRGNDTLSTFNELDQVVERRSAVIGSVRYQTRHWYDAAGNLVRTDVDNRDQTGAQDPANTHWSEIIGYETLNQRSLQARERIAVNLGDGVTSFAALGGLQANFEVVEYRYDANRNMTIKRKGQAFAGVDPFNVEQTSYDERNLPLRRIQAPGAPGPGGQSSTQYDYDANRNLLRETRGLEHAAPRLTTFAYDGYDRRIQAIDAMGNVSTWTYDADSNRMSERVDGELLDVPGSAGNVRLREHTYQYDALDRLIRTDRVYFDPQSQAPIGDGQSTTLIAYNDHGTRASVTDDNLHITSYQYDTAHRRSRITDPIGNSAALTRDANGNIVARTDTHVPTGPGIPEIYTSTFQYDALNRMTQSTDNAGNTRAWKYDSRSHAAISVDGRGDQVLYVYDGLDRLIRKVTDMDADGPDGNGPDITTTQTFDLTGRRVATTDGTGKATTYAYDSLDRLVRTQPPDGTLRSVQFDQRDDAVRVVDGNGSIIDNSYDSIDRLTGRIIIPGPGVAQPPPLGPGTGFETYRYDGLSRLVEAQDDDSIVRRGAGGPYGYDSLGRVEIELQMLTLVGAPPRTVTTTHDGVGSQASIAYPGGLVIERFFDPLDRPLDVHSSPPTLTSPIASYQYIGPGRIKQRTYGNSTVTDYAYDAVPRMTSIVHRTGGGVPFDQRGYTYDADHNRIRESHGLLMPIDDEQRLFDPASRLTNSGPGVGLPEYEPGVHYQLDGAANRNSVGGGPDAGPYTLDATAPDPADWQVNQYTSTPHDTRHYDGAGNLVSAAGVGAGTARSMVYDYANRLVQFTNLSTGVVTTYAYDALGRRVLKQTGGTTERYLYDGWKVIEDQDVAGATLRSYVYSYGIDHRIQMRQGASRYYLHEDSLRSIVKVTDAAGSITDQFEYHDYGEPYTPGEQPGDLLYVFDSDRDPNPMAIAPEIADDLWFASSTQLIALTWRGGYDYAPVVPSQDQFTLTIYHSNPGTGRPDAILQQFVLSPSQVVRTPTGRTVCCASIGPVQEFQYRAVLPAPVPLAANTRYWVSVRNSTFGSPATWGWEGSGAGNGLCSYRLLPADPWLTAYSDMAMSPTVSGPPSSGLSYLFGGARYDAESGWLWCLDGYADPIAGRMVSRATCGIATDTTQPLNLYTFQADNPTTVALICCGCQDVKCKWKDVPCEIEWNYSTALFGTPKDAKFAEFVYDISDCTLPPPCTVSKRGTIQAAADPLDYCRPKNLKDVERARADAAKAWEECMTDDLTSTAYHVEGAASYGLTDLLHAFDCYTKFMRTLGKVKGECECCCMP